MKFLFRLCVAFSVLTGIMPAPTASASPTMLAAAASKTYVAQKGDTLMSIAQKFYGDASKWRLIASANNLTSMSVQPGQVLVIPAIQ